MTYTLVVWGVLSIFRESLSYYWVKPSFWLPLIASVIFVYARLRWPRQTSKYLMIIVCFALMAIGITLVFLSSVVTLWVKPPWDPSVLGTGVSIIALGISLAVVFWPPRPLISTRNFNNEVYNVIDYDASLGRITSKFWNKLKSPWVVSGIFSILLLALFMFLQNMASGTLALDVKWIIVSAIPILITIIVGGYIKVFKGFGVELEMRIKEPIKSLDFVATDVYISLEGISKQTIAEIDRISIDRKLKITRLQFISNLRHYYESFAISVYMQELPNLEYFEIVGNHGQFICLLPINIFKRQNENELYSFISTLEDDRVLQVFGNSAITFTIGQNQSIIEVLETLRAHMLEVAVVQDDKGKVLGLIKTSDIEKRIATELLFQIKHKK
jgi:hypothetical protein